MRRFSQSLLLLIGLLLSSGTSAALAENPPARIDMAALDVRLGQTLDRGLANGVPGVLLAVGLPGQEPWVGARGLAERDSTAMTVQHRFRIASITKMFVATVALQLVQEGWLSLDQTVEQWLPGLLPNGKKITVRQLMRHTSGLYDYMDGPFIKGVLAEPEREWQPSELVEYSVAHGAVFAPGARGRWSYSNTNYVVLGMLIEQVTNTTLAHEIDFRILEPLELHDTSFTTDLTQPELLAHGYDRRRDLTNIDMSFAWAAGNMTSSGPDLVWFTQGLFGGKLLGPAMLTEMRTFGAVQGREWSRTLGYGLGLMRETLRSGDSAIVSQGHTGWLNGYRTALWYDP
jgi:D-alanyl-D-alanine carboxypeptidase